MNIQEDFTKRDIKRQVLVELNRKVSQQVLRSLAYRIGSQEKSKYQRTFISYIIKDSGFGYWAHTHFNPDLEIQILGTTVEEDEKIMQSNSSTAKKIDTLGVWYTEWSDVGKIILYKKYTAAIVV